MPATPPAGPRAAAAGAALLLALALLAAGVALVILRLQPPPPLGDDAPTARFSAARAAAALGAVLGDEAPHPIGSTASAANRDRLVAQLSALGLAPEIQASVACGRRSVTCGRVENVVARLGAAGRPALLLSAHRDSVAAGPGAGDDGSGVAVLLELARIFAREPPPGRDVIFLFVDGEEVGLLGAEAFVAAHPWAADVEVALNLDAGGNRGVATFTRASPGAGPAIAAIAGAVARPHAASLTATVYALTPYDTDFSAYDRAGVLTLDLGIGEDKAPYHTPLDRLDALDRGSLQHLGDTAQEAAVALASAELPGGAGGRAYLDLLGWTLWTCPSGNVPWIGAAALALAFAALADLRRRRLLDPRELGAALLAWPLLVALPTAAAALLALALALVAGAEAAGQATPAIPRVALWAAVFAASGALARRLARRAGPWACWSAAWLWLAALSALVAALDPGASVALLPPVLAALAVYFALALPRRPPAAPPLAPIALAGLALPALLWGQAALRVEALFGLGRHGAAAALAPLALLLALLAPLWIGAGRRLSRALLMVSLGTCLIGAIAALAAPAHSPQRPRRLSLVHHQADGEPAGRWLIGDVPGGLPKPLRAAAAFADPAPAFPWVADDDPSWIAPAPPLLAPAPELVVVADARGQGVRLLRLRLTSPRGARSAWLVLPEAADLRAIAIDGRALPAYPEARRRDYPDHRVYAVAALPPEGAAIDLLLGPRAPTPLPIAVVDAADGLPAHPAAEALARARPADAVPSHAGDRSLMSRELAL